MPHLHLKRIHTNTAKILKSSLFNVVNGAIVRPLKLVNSQKQRLTALFFVSAMVASFLLPIYIKTEQAVAASQKSKPLSANDKLANNQKLSSNPDLSSIPNSAQQAKSIPSDKVGKSEIPNKPKSDRKIDTKNLVGNSEKSAQETLTDGTIARRVSATKQNTKQGNNWQSIDVSTKNDTEYAKRNKQSESIISKILPGTQTVQPKALNAKTSDLSVQLQTIMNGDGMVVSDGKKTVRFVPVTDKDKIVPEQIAKNGRSYVSYKDVWQGVDLQYDVSAESVKESIVLKQPGTNSTFMFKVLGGELVDAGEGYWQVKDSTISIAPFTVSVWGEGPLSNPPLKIEYKNGFFIVAVDNTWLKALPKTSFPVVVDPNLGAWRRGVANNSNSYIDYKSDGYVCSSANCWMYAGSLNQAGAGTRRWHTALQIPYGDSNGRYIESAWFHTNMRLGTASWVGYTDARWMYVTWLPAFNYNNGCCGAPVVSFQMGTDGWADISPIFRWLQSRGDYGGWLEIWGEEWNATSFKQLDPYGTFVDMYLVDYNAQPTAPTPIVPALPPNSSGNPQILTSTQPSFKMGASGDGNGDALKYWFRVMSSKPADCWNPVNILADSQLLSSLQWTVPDGVLEDGQTYWYCGYVNDGADATSHYAGGNYWNVTQPIPFKVDLRLGKNNTQVYDNVSGASVNLVTGNMTTSVGSNTMNALGGQMGINLDYNSPYSSQKGLNATYYNAAGGDSTKVALTRVDQNVDFDWGSSSPQPGVVQADNFAGNWQGYFVAPKTGTYYFGASNDDKFSASVNGTLVFDFGCCNAGWGTAPVQLTEGQVVPINVWMIEYSGAASAKLWVRAKDANGAQIINDQIVPTDWLRTNLQATKPNTGLSGKYYKLNDGEAFAIPQNRAPFMSRLDKTMNLNWGTGEFLPGSGIIDRVAVRWTGYLTVPQTTDYQFCVSADDGFRVYFDDTLYADFWKDQGATANQCGLLTRLTEGTTKRVTIEYYENGGAASMQFYVKWLNATRSETVPTNWLSPGAKILPDGWNMGIDPSGSVAYERLKQTSTGALIYDSNGATHEYSWTGSAYKPPVNEYGYLTQNTDNSFNLLDSDGRTYLFGTDGLLKTVTSPTDDLRPASLKYEYGGSPAHVTRVVDGVDPNRSLSVYYGGDSQCNTPTVPTGLVRAPAGMLCRTESTDENLTNFWYQKVITSSGEEVYRLSRLETSGGITQDIGYDELGRINRFKGTTASDVVSAGVRADDDSVTSQFTYDVLGRVQQVIAPAANAGDVRGIHTYRYVPNWSMTGSSDVVGYTEMKDGFTTGKDSKGVWQVTDASMPYGYSQRIEYDNLYRAVKTYAKDGLAAYKQWDPLKDLLLSTTDPLGLKSTTIYDANDLPTDTYGPAPETMYDEVIPQSTPTIATQTPGRNDMFVAGGSRNVLWKTVNNGSSNGWQSIGGCIAGAPSGVAVGATKYMVLAQSCSDPTKLTYAIYNGASWSSWKTLATANVLSTAAGTSWDGNRVDIVARGVASDAVTATYNVTNDTWTTWTSLGGCITDSPSITNWGVGRLDVWVRGCGSTPTVAMFQKTMIGSSWGDWVGFADFQTQTGPSAVAWGNNVLHIFGKGADGGLIHKWYSNGWSGVENQGGCILDKPWVSAWNNTRLDVVMRGCGTTGYRTYIKSWTGSAWTDFTLQQGTNKPLAAYSNQVPHTQTNYDEGMQGLAITYYGNKNLTGAPTLHATKFNNVPNASLGFATTESPTGVHTSDYSYTATGTITLPATGAYGLKLYHDDGARLFIDDIAVINEWTDGNERNSSIGTFTNQTANSIHRIKIDYYHTDNGAAQSGITQLLVTPPGGAEQSNVSAMLKPGYNLVTSSTTYDSQTTNTTIAKSYGSMPELGQEKSITADSTGLGLTTTIGYEPYQTGSLMRQVSKTLPGGNTYTYLYYGASEVHDNPCVINSKQVSQAGLAKGKIEPDPDGAGPLTGRTSESVYDASGRVIATRFNNDPWTCTTLDARGRITQTISPDINGRPGRMITNQYVFNGNPLVVSQSDSVSGTTQVQYDLLGRTVKTTDQFGYVTTISRDNFGNVTTIQSIKGTESYLYDNLDRPTSYSIDGKIYSITSYDSFSRVQGITYPQAQTASGTFQLTAIKRNALQQGTGATFTTSNRKVFDETINSSTQSGVVLSYTNMFDNKSASGNYSYDSGGRLTTATIDNMQYQYGFGAQDASCSGLAGYNAAANKNGNRTSYTVTNIATNSTTQTNSCYNNADQVISSSDSQVGIPVYDDHGNITQLAGAGLPINFSYSASDQNIAIYQGQNKVEYTKTADGSVIKKKEYRNGVLDKVYKNVSGVLLTCSTADENQCSITDKYFALAGGVGMTINGQPTYSIKNFHGDTALTLGADGTANSSVYMYDPFGQVINSATFGTNENPANAANGGMGWAANPSRKAESSFSIPIIQMGARVYLPTLGRFLQVDPVEGGTPNSYSYVLDPINYADYNGMNGFTNWMGNNWKKVAVAVAVVVVVVVACILLCAEIAAAAAVAAAAAAEFMAAAWTSAAVIGTSTLIRAGAVAAATGRVVSSASGKISSFFKGWSSTPTTSQLAPHASEADGAVSKTLTEPGAFARQSIPAPSTSQTFTQATRNQINNIGSKFGCHSCGIDSPGTKTGNWVPDHSPVTALMNPGESQILLPQCLSCSRLQGLEVARIMKGINDGF